MSDRNFNLGLETVKPFIKLPIIFGINGFFMYLHNQNILKYAQIARSGPSMIVDIEGHSNK